MRFAVTGGRFYNNEPAVIAALKQVPPAILVHGKAPGADTLAAKNWPADLQEPHPADWSGPCRATCRPGHRQVRQDGQMYCPAAGVYRNQEMVDSHIDFLIAFPGGTGTADMIERSLKARVIVVELSLEGKLVPIKR